MLEIGAIYREEAEITNTKLSAECFADNLKIGIRRKWF